MTPILVRPVREQLEHDRVIRELQSRCRRKYTVLTNQGAEQVASIAVGDNVLYPDLILTPHGARRPEAIVEVETAESVNNLEAMAEWMRLAQARAEFHLYVPAAAVNAAKRLCEGLDIPVTEIHAYHHIGDELRFASVYKAPPRPGKREPPAVPASPAAARAAAPRRARANGAGSRQATSRRTVKAAAAKRTRPAKKRVAKAAQKRK